MQRKKLVSSLIAIVLVVAIFAISFGPLLIANNMNKVLPHDPYEVSSQAQALHKTLIIGDWHADSTLWQRDLSGRSTVGHVDIPRLQDGNVALQMFTTVTKSPSGLNYEQNDADSDNITTLAYVQRWPSETYNSLTQRALYQAQKLHDLAAENDDFVLITNQQQLQSFLQQRQSQSNLVGGLLGTEGSHALDGNLENIQLLFDKGFRMMSLHHFFDNKLGSSLHGISQAGLTEFGRQAVLNMVGLDIMLDVSHSSPQVVEDVITITSRPLIVSHTGFRGHCDSPRNISDELMQKIANNGGIIAVGYWQGAVCGTSPQKVVEAIQYGINLVGEEHIALGSDFDGAVSTAFDTSELSVLTHEMLKAGMSEEQIRKVMGGNMLRFLQTHLPSGA